MNYKIGDRIRYINSINSDDMSLVEHYSDAEGNPAEAIVTGLKSSPDMVQAKIVTGPEAKVFALFLHSEIELVTPGMKILKAKRSNQGTGLKIYGEVLGESGKTYKFAYIRREGFRGWICSCESFFYEMFKKNRNCKHLRFVRAELGRFGAKVPKEVL